MIIGQKFYKEVYFCWQKQYGRICEGCVIIKKQFWWDDGNLDKM